MKKYRKSWALFCLILCGWALPGVASVGSDLTHFYNSIGVSSNVTQGHAFEGQQAGYYTGGSLYGRTQVRNYQLLSLTLPSVRAGCGGIDLVNGGFSYLGKGLEDAFKNIANNAASYAFMLGVETITPEIANEMKTLQNFANKVNMSNINSCETAAAAVGALWPKTDVAEQQVCSTLGASDNLFSDYTKARMACGDGNQRTKTLNRLQQDDTYRALVFQNINVAWEAIKQDHFLTTDSELAELLMNLSGSIIVISGSDDKAANHFNRIPSLADNPALIQALLYGGKVDIYRCDEATRCLNPTKQALTIEGTSGLVNQVNSLLDDMYQHIVNDTAITEPEKTLLNSTKFPLYKILSVQAAYTQGHALYNTQTLSEVVATELLQQYLSQNLNLVEVGSQRLQYPQDVMMKFQDGIKAARHRLELLYRNKLHAVNMDIALIEQTQTLERQLAGQLSSRLAGSLRWSQGL